MTKITKTKSLRNTTITIFAMLFIGLIFSIYYLLNTIMMDSIYQLENKNVNENVERVFNALELEKSNMASIAQDWGAWDDTYEFVENGNKHYIENNLHEDGFLNLNLNLMAFIDSNGKYIFAKGMDIENEKFVPLYTDLEEVLEESHIIGNKDTGNKMQGIIMLSEGPMLIATHPIITSNFEGPVRGNVVFGRFLNDAAVKELSERLNLDITLERIGEMNKGSVLEAKTAAKPSIEIKELGNNRISGITTLKDIYNKPVLSLSIEMDREVKRVGKEGISYMLYSLMAAGLIFTLALMLFIEKNILSRLLELSREVLHIGNRGSVAMRLKPQQKRDEIFILSDEINRMLEKLEESEKQLREAHNSLEIKVDERTQELFEANELLKTEIEERKKIQERVTHLAYHDHLTGLPNRLLFTDRLSQAIFLARRTEKPLGVIFVDLDAFKMVNDTMGHDQGDELLKEVAKRLAASVRCDDTVCRVGGDEFILMVQNIADPEDIAKIAEKIVGCFEQPYKLKGQDFYVTSSVGVAMYPTDGDDVETLIKNADIAMYKAKESGKNQYVMCTPIMKNKVMETMTLTNSLYRALHRNELMLYYQPQVSCNSGKIIGVEALLRWNHPELGFVPPSKFIPLAEQTGLIMSIGDWVLKTACKQNKAWRDAGLPHIRMAVNLSLQQLQNPNIVMRVEEILKETGLSPKCLELEITESIAMNDSGHVTDVLNLFKRKGITISIDDFGTEYSSLSRLKQLPIDRIKIAMPFVQGISVSEKDEAITKAIIVLAKNLGMHTIAEGVETKQQLDFLSQRMCEEIQGFYYYKPLPAEEIEAILRADGLLKLKDDE